MPTTKDDETEVLRRLVQSSDELNETDRADLGLTTLSFQSVRFPNRHVWVDTDLAGQISIDLEDWQTDETWDNSVAHLSAASTETCSAVILAWLSGQPIATCRQISSQDPEV
jgi:hypothetical protein